VVSASIPLSLVAVVGPWLLLSAKTLGSPKLNSGAPPELAPEGAVLSLTQKMRKSLVVV